MVKRRGRPRKVAPANYPEFFKVYLPNHSSHQLRIPPAFIRYFHGAVPSKVILRDLGGKVWHVDMEETESNLVIKHGWRSFVSDHSLELGDFLVFKYNGDSLFDVILYGKNGCKKQQTVDHEKMAVRVKLEEETEAEQVCAVPHRNAKKKCPETGQYMKSRDLPAESQPNSRSIVSETTEECEDVDAGELVLPKIPTFIVSINPSRVYNVYIPRRYLLEHAIELKPEEMLIDQDGKSWPVKVTSDKCGRYSIGRGWMDFWKGKGMEFGDKCIFEFVRGSGRAIKEVHVRMLGATEKTQNDAFEEEDTVLQTQDDTVEEDAALQAQNDAALEIDAYREISSPTQLS